MAKNINPIVFFFLSLKALSHVGSVTSTTQDPARLEVNSEDQEFLLSRTTSIQRNADFATANRLQNYETNTNSIWYFNSAFWINCCFWQKKYSNNSAKGRNLNRRVIARSYLLKLFLRKYAYKHLLFYTHYKTYSSLKPIDLQHLA